MAAPVTGSAQAGGGGKTDGGTTIVLLLAFAVFFILGGVTNINDLLVGKFKPMFQLSHAEANLVQMAFFIAYALVSIPAGIVMSKLGYIRTFVLGFLMVAAAALLFVPASASASYGGFLAALFFIGAGITVLQVAMNPIITTLGPPETAHSRLTFAQAFNSIGVFLMVYGGATVLLGGETHFDAAGATPEAIKAYQVEQGASIGNAYFWLAVVMLGIAAVFWAFRRSLDHAKAEKAQVAGPPGLAGQQRRIDPSRLPAGAPALFGGNVPQDRVLAIDRAPAVTAQFIVKLARPPAGIAQRDQKAAWSPSGGNCPQHFQRARQGAQPRRDDGAGRVPIGRMQHKAALLLHRPAIQHRQIGRGAGIDFQVLQHFVQAQVVAFAAQADAQCAAGIVDEHGNRRMIEPGIAHSRHGQQELSGKAGRFAHGAQPRPVSCGTQPSAHRSAAPGRPDAAAPPRPARAARCRGPCGPDHPAGRHG